MSKPKRNSTKRRLQLDLEEESFYQLDMLVNVLGAASYSETVRNALGVLRWVLEELQQGNDIFAGKKEGEGKQELKQVVFPFFPFVPKM